MRWSHIIVAAAAAATGIGASAVLYSAKPAVPRADFVTLQGEKVSTQSLRGKVVLVNFWSTSCVTCVEEMPKIVDTYRKYRDRGFETVAVAMSYDPPNYVLAYAVSKKLPFKVALDPVGNVARSFGEIEATPTTFVLDKRGRVVARWVGEPDFGKLDALLETKLKEPA
ncbi:MAG TPA: TlpA disulfide reductase family protein [Burkholderiales bacterium]